VNGVCAQGRRTLWLSFRAVVWCGAGGGFADLAPDAFGRIEFRRSGWKLIGRDARMTCQEVLHLAATMDGMLVPEQHDGTRDVLQQVLEKGDHLVPTDRVPIGLHVQLDLAFARAHPQSTNQIEAFVVLNARADGRRLSAWRPGALQWADQRKPAFIGKNQAGAQRLPLFLSGARHSVSNGRPLHRRVRTCAVAVFGNSSLNVVRHTKHRSAGSAP
jgi:hypothetical protein